MTQTYYLNLISNNLTQIEPNAFMGLENLINLYLLSLIFNISKGFS